MARYRASIETQWMPEQAFAYLSDFSTSAEWDPGVVEAKRAGAGAVGKGTEFRLVAKFLGAKDTAHLPGRRVRAAERGHVRGRERGRRLA